MSEKNGLEGVIAADTALSHVDGAGGRLIVRGHELRDLVECFDFEGVSALLLSELEPQASRTEEWRRLLGFARRAAFAQLDCLLPATRGLPASDALSVMLAGLGDPGDPRLGEAAWVIGAIPVLIAAADRASRELDPIPPDDGHGHAQSFLAMLSGSVPEAGAVRALDRYLVTVADHGLNASTFAARIVASTRAGLVSAAVAGLAALKGPLHGGAPGPVLDMLDAIGEPALAARRVAEALARGERLMGFGHRIYRVRDPRADVLRAALAWVRSPRLDLAEAVERAALAELALAKPGRRLETNVEFYTALLLEAVGLDRRLFTPVFAMGRVAGWTAHALEQVATGRLIRPESRYVGPMPDVEQRRTG